MNKTMAILALCATACSSAPTPAPPAKPAAPVEAPKTTVRTYRLTAPSTWQRQDHDDFETFIGPEGALKLHVVEATSADLDQAIADGWKLVSPTMSLKERQRSQGAPESRFREQLVITYIDDAQENFAQGIARRHVSENRTYLFLVEGPLKEVRKRNAELVQVMSSMEIDGATKLEVNVEDLEPFDEKRRKAFFDAVEKARTIAGVPGLAVGVVTPQGTFTRGFGKREEGQDAPVDADTQFMIGSVTKSFSTLLLATLVDDGKVTWESVAHEVYEPFRVADDARTDAIQIQHLFCACTGAPRQDMELLFDFEGVTATDMFRSAAAMKLTTKLGETFQYNNQLTAVGGYIAGHLAFPKEADLGAAYSRALRERVLAPLAMSHTTLSPGEVVKRGNFATPHSLDWSGANVKVALSHERFALPVAPAGALWSTAADMSRYLGLQLGKGKVGDKQIVSSKNLQRTQTEQIKTSDRSGYGMGWVIGKDRGLEAIRHGGGTMGFNTLLVFYPEIQIGLFVVANRSPSAMNGRVRELLLETLFETEPRALAGLKKNFSEMTRLMNEGREKVSDKVVPPSLIGRYESPRLGAIHLRSKNGKVELDAGEWAAEVAMVDEKDQPNSLIMTSGPMQGGRLLIEDGKLILKHSQTDYTFVRK